MKIFIFLLATICVSDSSAGSSAGSHVTYNVVATPSHGISSGGHGHGSSYESHGHVHGHDHSHGHYHSHGHGGTAGPAPQVIKIILDQSQGYSNGGGGSAGGHASFGGHSYGGHDHGYGSSGYGEAQIFKVITQSAPTPVHIENIYSGGSSHGYSGGSSYASGYSHDGGSHGVNSQLKSILPQILQLILQNDAGSSFGGGGGGYIDYNDQLIAHFGHKGKAVITRSDGKSNSFSSGGHVVQKGVLEVKRVEENAGTSVAAPHPPTHGPPPHGPPHGHWHPPPSSSGW